MASQTSTSTIPDPVVPPVVDDPPTEAPPTIPLPEPDPTHSPVLPQPGGTPSRTRAAGRASTPEPGTYEELYDEARRRKLPGRSTMSKTELARALGR